MQKFQNTKKSYDLNKLKAGQWLELSGDLIVMRDAAHRRLLSNKDAEKELPIKLEGKIIFYAGPTSSFIDGGGVIGPTTSARLDRFVEGMLKLGVKGFLGKGPRSNEVSALLKKYKAVYLATVGGVAALLSKFVKGARIVAYQDLGPEAVYHLEVAKLPAIVAIDTNGQSIWRKAND